MLLLASLLFSGFSSGEPVSDSIPLREAHRSLEEGDTLRAIEILDEWASEHQAGPELNDLLGRLHLPDEPVDSAPRVQSPRPAPPQGRKWRLRVDGGAIASDPWFWDLGATLATRWATLDLGGSPTVLEAGLATAVWSTETETPRWAAEPLLSLSVQKGVWDFRFQGWSGAFDGEWDAGGMATGSIASDDSRGTRRRWGGVLRGSLVSTSLAGVFGQWSHAGGSWTEEARSDLRLRYDPVVEKSSSSGDSLRIRAMRLQSLSRALALRHFGSWGVGPALELDLRTSFAPDRWADSGSTYREKVRQDLSFSGGAVARYAPRGDRWFEFRLGWTGAGMDSPIDRSYSDRNTGWTTSFASGLSF